LKDKLTVNLTHVTYLPFISLLQDIYENPRVDTRTKNLASIGLMLAKNNGAVQSRRYQANKKDLVEHERYDEYYQIGQKALLFALTSVLWCYPRYAIRTKFSMPILVLLQRVTTSTLAATGTSLVLLERDLVKNHKPEYSVALYWLAAVSQIVIMNSGIRFIIIPYLMNMVLSGML
jgi:hypothetical protein